MDFLEVTNQIQRNTDINSLADQAQYGVSFAKRGDYGEKTFEYLDAGIRFCTIIRDGAEAASLDKIRPSQLGVAEIFSILEEKGENPQEVKERVSKAIELLEAIKRREVISDEQIENLEKLLYELSNPYQMAAHATIAFLRQNEGLY